MTLARLFLAAMMVATMAAAPAAEAAKGPSKPPSSAAKVKKCAKGEIWSKTKKKCIKTTSGAIPDEDLYWQGRELALAGEYAWALQVFAAIRNQDDPGVLKFIGYSYRKSGQFETGIGYYHRALILAPDDLEVREYLGEGYASIGKLDLAKEQLREIALRCGTDCHEYEDLAEAIAGVETP